ncbi:hypothetical protein ACQZV8_06935 [Magnetococcales bacterium HHB-1]
MPEDHILIELKMRESITVGAFKKISAYDYFYLQREKLDREKLQSVLVGAITPRRDILRKFSFEPMEAPGVYICKRSPWGENLRVILLNELDDKPHNAFLKCFASRKAERKKAFATLMRSDWLRHSLKLLHLINTLRRRWMEVTEETLEYDDITEEEYRAWTRELVLSAMPIEEIFEDPEFSKKIFEGSEFSKYLIQAREEGKAKGRVEGKAEGRAEGKAEGRAEGKAEGKAEGRAEGKAEGKAEGRAEGKAEGARSQAVFLQRVLEEKFGSLPVESVERLFNADLEQLTVWSARVFEADSLKEVFQ